MKRAPLVAVAGNATEISAPDFQDTFGADWNLGAGNNQILNRPSFFVYTVLGNNTVATWRKVATIGASTDGTYDQLKLSGVVNDNWLAIGNTPIEIVFSNRAVAGTDYTGAIQWTLRGPVRINMRIVAYKEDSGALSIYVATRASTFGTCAFSAQWYAQTISVIPPAQVVAQTTTPTGTLVFDSGNVNQVIPLYYQANSLVTDFPQGLAAGFAPRSVGNAYNELLGGSAAAARDTYYPQYRIRVTGIDAAAVPGAFGFATSIPSGSTSTTSRTSYRMALRVIDDSVTSWSDPVAYFQGNGDFATLGKTRLGDTVDPSWSDADPYTHYILNRRPQVDLTTPLIARYGMTTAGQGPSLSIAGTYAGGGWNPASCILYVSQRNDSLRSIATTGTVNTSGTDYAEYMRKNASCGTVVAGQVVGIDVNGEITDKFSQAIKFCVKSSNPSFVGGDTWANGLVRPDAPARVAPVYKTVIDVEAQPADAETGEPAVAEQSHQELVSAGDTDDEWTAKEVAYKQAATQFEHDLEVRRKEVDRIAYCGQVPVNVLNAVPGQHLVIAVTDGDAIGLVLVNDDDLTFKQYKASIGQVIAVEEDGRARIIVRM